MTGRIVYRKVMGEKHLADLLRKDMPAELTNRQVGTSNMKWCQGRAATAPTLDAEESWVHKWRDDCFSEEKHLDNVTSNRIIK